MYYFDQGGMPILCLHSPGRPGEAEEFSRVFKCPQRQALWEAALAGDETAKLALSDWYKDREVPACQEVCR